jgi:endogenous inhibitor of DNA gyrase (YacG/DUF329 family)
MKARYCDNCGKPLEPGRTRRARFCGKTCQQADYRRRLKAKAELDQIMLEQGRQQMLRKLRDVLPATSRHVENVVKIVGWSCVDEMIRACLMAYYEAKNGA